MANTFNNIKDAPGIIAKAAAQTLKDNLVFTSNISKADASDFEGKNGYKAGDTIYTSKPARFDPQETFDITSSMQDITEEKVALSLDTISTVGMNIDSFEFATEVELKDTIKRAVIPAAEAIAMDVERRFLEKATDATYNLVGTAGSNTFTVADVLAGRTKLNMNLAPRAERSFLLNSQSGALAVDARKGLFQDSSQVGKQYIEGMVGRADGFMWYENELVNVHTNGNDVAFEVRTTVSTQGQATLVVEGLTTTTGTVKKGTVFTVAGVYSVHPITKQTYSTLQQFVVTADATADGSGYATLSISPAMYTTGTLQNIASFPQDGNAITPSGSASTSYAQNLQFHKNAFKMVSVPLIMPTKAEVAAQETVDGITVAVIRDFDVKTRTMITRLDFLGGLSAVRPEWACRVTA
jgi:hypothetical protein